MSFQGDVAGLGLGELLQGLARGGREGVLTLYGGGLSATLGVLSGQIHLLPEPDEDPELWRKRCGRAWIEDPNERVDALRMIEIAYAARLERMFELLDCEGVHFRFEPGPLPNSDPLSTDAEVDQSIKRPARLEASGAVYCPPVSVEFLLLEHARLSDECGAHDGTRQMSNHEVPCPLVAPSSFPDDKLLAECSGESNVIEISDRMAWPLRQTKAALITRVLAGRLRLANANEFAALTSIELSKNRFLRAASRLSGWARNAQPGVPDPDEAQLLIDEWNGGKLVLALAGTSSSDTRTILRRMELAEADTQASLARWREICKHHRHDLIAEVHVLRLGLALDEESQKPTFAELLKVARNFIDQGRLMRAGAMLTAAAARNPENTQNRLELGNRMLACGLTSSATPWLLESCRALINGGLADKALAPLRALVAADPANRDARSLFSAARARSTQGKAKTRNLWIALSVALILGVGALVQVQSDHSVQRRLTEIETSGQQPGLLLRAMEDEFPDSTNPRVRELKRSFFDSIRRREMQLRETWLNQYAECKQECATGDPLFGLERTLQLPAPPTLTTSREPWPTTSDILQGLAARLEQSVGELGQEGIIPGATDNGERRLAVQVRELLSLGKSHASSDALDGFVGRLQQLLGTLRARDETRAAIQSETTARDNANRQEQLLSKARALDKAGELDRASECYKELKESDTGGMLTKALEPEIRALETHRGALSRARELSRAGLHVKALAELELGCPAPWEHMLPWRVEATPAGARARFSDGTVRVTPFTIETAPNERIDFTLELPGFEPAMVRSESPANVAVALSRLPQRWWRTEGLVEAPPVAVQDEHVLVDRKGAVVRMGATGALRWQMALDSLSGIARAPVFLPGRAGTLLCLTEDGNAWIVECAEGHVEGPWDVGSPPLAGPYVLDNSVRARFSSGHEASWESRLKPDLSEFAEESGKLSAVEQESRRGSDAGMQLLRRRDAGHDAVLDSQWAPWTVEVREDAFVVRERARSSAQFTVRRQGDWTYVAWEAPNVRSPLGRLWISDGAGLRAFDL